MKIDRMINFLGADGIWIINVSIFNNTHFKIPREWLDVENKKIEGLGVEKKIEKILKVDGSDAMVVYAKTDTEEYLAEKETAFIKDGNLYLITSKHSINAQENIWKLKFIK